MDWLNLIDTTCIFCTKNVILPTERHCTVVMVSKTAVACMVYRTLQCTAWSPAAKSEHGWSLSQRRCTYWDDLMLVPAIYFNFQFKWFIAILLIAKRRFQAMYLHVQNFTLKLKNLLKLNLKYQRKYIWQNVFSSFKIGPKLANQLSWAINWSAIDFHCNLLLRGKRVYKLKCKSSESELLTKTARGWLGRSEVGVRGWSKAANRCHCCAAKISNHTLVTHHTRLLIRAVH